MLLEEFFSTGGQVALEGPLFLKNDSKKGWKRYHCVLRASGLYYYPKEKTKSAKDLILLAILANHDVYRGINWKKKNKAPTDFTFALRSPKAGVKGDRAIKMLCCENLAELEKWVLNIRVAKYGRKLLENHKTLLEDLAREELDKLSSARSGSMGSIASIVPSQCSTGSDSGNTNGRLSRASSSSSSGCLSDDNNGFDSEFTTGTIKRKPTMKPNLPLTSMTGKLKEVGETTRFSESNPNSPERGGTLTRRHSRKRSEDSISSGTLKRRTNSSRSSMDSMSSNTSTPTPTPLPSLPSTPTISNNVFTENGPKLSPMEIMPSCLTDSMFSLPPAPEDLGMNLSLSTLSLDSLPPPPSQDELDRNLSGSQVSLASLPPPPPELNPIVNTYANARLCSPELEKPKFIVTAQQPLQASVIPKPITTTTSKQQQQLQSQLQQQLASQLQQQLLMKRQQMQMTPQPIQGQKQPMYAVDNGQHIYAPAKPSIKSQTYMSSTIYTNGNRSVPSAVPAPPAIKSVSFVESPVLLRRKVCFEDQVQNIPISPKRQTVQNVPLPPLRSEFTRLSHSHTAPMQLADSSVNPAPQFLKNLERVIKKKWQVAEKCKVDTTTTPHEVLGFRDVPRGQDASSHYYNSANVSHWIQENFGDQLYENMGNNLGMEPMFPSQQSQLKKRPPPPPPKRANSTQLTTTNQRI